jgi:hypothetical protein
MITDEIKAKGLFYYIIEILWGVGWRSLGESNPCFSLERAIANITMIAQLQSAAVFPKRIGMRLFPAIESKWSAQCFIIALRSLRYSARL